MIMKGIPVGSKDLNPRCHIPGESQKLYSHPGKPEEGREIEGKKKTKMKNKAKSLPCYNKHMFGTLYQELDSLLWILTSQPGKDPASAKMALTPG